MKTQSVYQQIKNCPNINKRMKERALKELKTIQRSLTLRKQCDYKGEVAVVPLRSYDTLGSLMLWSQTSSGYRFWAKVNRLINDDGTLY